MNLHVIDLPERDKLAAGYGRVSDVFDYYPEGVVFPVFLNESMEKVTVIPNGDEYIVYPGTGRHKGDGIHGTNCSLFSEVVDHAKELLVNVPVPASYKSLFSIPQRV